MKINDLIKNRREELKLSHKDVADYAGLSVYAYYDIEAIPDEIITAVKLSIVKKICTILSIDFMSLFQIKCHFCHGNDSINMEYKLPRNLIIKNRRESIGLNKCELGDKIGFYEVAITDLEESADFLEEWPINIIDELSTILKIPSQVLFAVKCTNCNSD